MILTGAERDTVLRALKLAIKYRLSEKNSFVVLARNHPQKGRIVNGDRDITEQVERDLTDLRALQRRMRHG